MFYWEFRNISKCLEIENTSSGGGGVRLRETRAGNASYLLSCLYNYSPAAFVRTEILNRVEKYTEEDDLSLLHFLLYKFAVKVNARGSCGPAIFPRGKSGEEHSFAGHEAINSAQLHSAAPATSASIVIVSVPPGRICDLPLQPVN